ncbi:hypothetical protein Cgig2_028400 [Carnegiea gigantea]|uniref:WD repeat-containing protein 44 n=1 Tax=Carnegiea gigantea TaxID=171969 RepID=A0A9Q1K1S5_9CARY|nr:hypothetical protein Cgig2_028400 [Carnegiea gigantea]
MMDTCSDHGEHQFFDALEEVTEFSESGLDCQGNSYSGSRGSVSLSSSTQFDIWIQRPESVEARRSKFFNWLGLDVDKSSNDDSKDNCDFEEEVDRIPSMSGAVLRSPSFDKRLLSNWSFTSYSSVNDFELHGDLIRKENLDGGEESNVADQNRESVSDIVVRIEQTDRCSSSSSTSSEFSMVGNTAMGSSVWPTKSMKKWWLGRLRSFTCVMESGDESCKCDLTAGARVQRVKVHQSKKQSKELSALYFGQNIQAHKGAILTMKFSPDGQFLASAGEDGIVRIWQVVEDDRSNEHDIPDMDPSCVYFTMDHLSELKPLSMDRGKSGKLRRTSDSACVVLPPKVFRLLEKPLHEFQGHTGEILDISWSRHNCLLSSSVDKTVCLWAVGLDHCLKVFPHNDYGECLLSFREESLAQLLGVAVFIPYQLCREILQSNKFCFCVSDNQLELDAPIFLHNKKKSSGKRITGFQFSPQDSSKVMVSCADSQVRVIQGVNVIGLRSTGSYCSAFLTSDGRHIVSASEDSNVYVWNCVDINYQDPSQITKVKSCERFLSNASVALPWPGLQIENRRRGRRNGASSGTPHGGCSVLSPANFSCGQEYIFESYCSKGSALWPEEKLLTRSPLGITSSIHKSEYKFLRTCQSISDSHAWGLVIVTAGWDGQIRSFHNYGLPVPH